MVATPLLPGSLYHVRGLGLDRVLFASNGAHAIVLALDFFHHDKE